jgi:broad specificity phosphatase PhoE
LGRARRTCELAGFGDKAEVDPKLHEWDYGDYEGRRTSDIRQEKPDWYLFRDGCPGGESIAAIGARVDRVIARLRRIDGDVLLFSYRH